MNALSVSMTTELAMQRAKTYPDASNPTLGQPKLTTL